MTEKAITLRIPENIHKKLLQEAKRKGQTMNVYMVILLWTYLEAHAP